MFFSTVFSPYWISQGKDKEREKVKGEKQYQAKSNTKDDCETIWG